MADQNVPVVAPGWYPDPTRGNQLRWWDGMQWTEHTPGPAPALRAPEGTDPSTLWIWLHLFVPAIVLIPMFFIDWRGLVTFDVDDPAGIVEAQLAVFVSAAYLATIVVSFVAYGLTVVFAFLDYRELLRRQVPRPFHWAFAFLSNYVYVIGRSVVVGRRTGRGYAPLWVAIALFMLWIIGSLVLTFWIMALAFEQIPYLPA